MAGNKPKVFISSTIYDFRDLRSSLKYWLEERGFQVHLSEYSDFPVSSEVNSYENCLNTIDDCDYFILLIGNRIGGWFNKSKRISITQAEYRRAYENLNNGKAIQIIPFVRQEIWDIREDRKALEKYLEECTCLEKEEKKAIVNHPSKFVSDATFVFAFISEVCRHDEMRESRNADRPKGNWVCTFSTFEQIVDALDVRFHVKTDIEKKRMLFKVKEEICNNLSSLLQKHKGKIHEGFVGADIAYTDVSQCSRKLIHLKWKYYKWLLLHTVMIRSGLITNQFISKAVIEGYFLEFDCNTHFFKNTPLHRALFEMNKQIKYIANPEHHHFSEAHNILKENKYAHGEDEVVTIDFLHIVFHLALYAAHRNIVILSALILRFMDGNAHVLNNFEKHILPFVPFQDHKKEIDETTVTPQEAEAWILSENS